jgi:hypothetical protein
MRAAQHFINTTKRTLWKLFAAPSKSSFLFFSSFSLLFSQPIPFPCPQKKAF